MQSEAKLGSGTKVGFTPSSGNPDGGKVHKIAGHETHNGLLFYRLRGKIGGLFLRSSLYV
jgi:hypothetical protein